MCHPTSCSIVEYPWSILPHWVLAASSCINGGPLSRTFDPPLDGVKSPHIACVLGSGVLPGRVLGFDVAQTHPEDGDTISTAQDIRPNYDLLWKLYIYI